ncbi:putative membrane protein [Halovivax ruber XH-70]|uniref:Putative membrane protein n=1 Tax=Halovivax ruber (strain DSM 18193 / JCM 13892 / XH-70) TaxID=797302 RepID=L0ID73_HALRX|nr:AzlD domain-containing protein [Halovivax ruber]AGB16176.1 putative membrane protein [Halovivax ruber XH-70]
MADLGLDPFVAAVILAMAVATFATKVGGLWVLSRVEVSDRVEAGLSVLPGAIVVSILGPELVDGGPAEWAAAGVVAFVAWRTNRLLVALLAGLVAVVGFRALL